MGSFRNIPKIDKLKLDDSAHLIKMCEYYINKFCEEYKIEDIAKASEIRFKAALIYIFNSYFKLSLYTDKKRQPHIDSVIDYTDIGQLTALCDSYIYICGVCDKIPSIAGFSSYTGIEFATLERWRDSFENRNIYNDDIQNDNDNTISKCIEVYNNTNNSNIDNNTINTIYDYDYINSIKNINDYSVYKRHLDITKYLIINRLNNNKEAALADRLASGGAGQVGIIAILNHQYNWANSSPSITINTPTISLADLPQLPQSGGGGAVGN